VEPDPGYRRTVVRSGFLERSTAAADHELVGNRYRISLPRRTLYATQPPPCAPAGVVDPRALYARRLGKVALQE
jgi:hypothetical protein